MVQFQLLLRHVSDFLPAEVIPHTQTLDGAPDRTGACLTAKTELLAKAVRIVPIGTATPLPTVRLRALLPLLELNNLYVGVPFQILTLDERHWSTLVLESSGHTIVIKATSVVTVTIHTCPEKSKRGMYDFGTVYRDIIVLFYFRSYILENNLDIIKIYIVVSCYSKVISYLYPV